MGLYLHNTLFNEVPDEKYDHKDVNSDGHQ